MTPENKPPQPPEGPRNDNPWRQVGVALSLVFVLPAAVGIGAMAGWWLDGKLGTEPWLTVLLVGAGFAGGVREVLRELNRVSRK